MIAGAMPDVKRKLRARQTRARIAAAGARLFAERGYQGTPMDAIAAEAGVAVQTVYFAFHTKAELLIAAYDQAVLGDLDGPLPDQQEWYRRSVEEPDGRAALRHLVDGSLEILNRSGPLHPVMLTSPDEEVRVAFRQRQEFRFAAYERIVRNLSEHHALRPGLDERTAADLLFTLTSPELHNMLCGGRRWTPDAYRTWVLSTLEAQLLGRAE
jgi:AcrR family transcriptional regulator